LPGPGRITQHKAGQVVIAKCRGVHRHYPTDMNQFRDEIIMPNIKPRFATYGTPLINIARTALLAAATVFLYWKARQLAVKNTLKHGRIKFDVKPKPKSLIFQLKC